MKMKLLIMTGLSLFSLGASARCIETRNGQRCDLPDNWKWEVKATKISCQGLMTNLNIEYKKFPWIEGSTRLPSQEELSYVFQYSESPKCPSRLCGSIRNYSIQHASQDPGAETSIYRTEVNGLLSIHLELSGNAWPYEKFVFSYHIDAQGQFVLEKFNLGEKEMNPAYLQCQLLQPD